MTRLETSLLAADKLPGDSVAALYFTDRRPLHGPAALLDWRLDGQLTRMMLDGQLRGRMGEHVLLPNNGKLKAERVLFVGGGSWYGLSESSYISLLKQTLEVVKQAGFRYISLSLEPHDQLDSHGIQAHLQTLMRQCGDSLKVCRLSCEPLDR